MLNLSFHVENAKTYVLRHLLTFIVASIPFPAMGAIYHTIWRHRGTLTRRAVNKCFTTRPACLEPRRTAEPSAMRRSSTIGETAMQVYVERQRGRCLALAENPAEGRLQQVPLAMPTSSSTGLAVGTPPAFPWFCKEGNACKRWLESSCLFGIDEGVIKSPPHRLLLVRTKV
jgi:hypothetical protein